MSAVRGLMGINQQAPEVLVKDSGSQATNRIQHAERSQEHSVCGEGHRGCSFSAV